MTANVERSCSMLIHYEKGGAGSEITAALEGGDMAGKVRALQKAIMMLVAGESMPALFITIVRYVLPSEDHTLQKLLLLYLVRPSLCPPTLTTPNSGLQIRVSDGDSILHACLFTRHGCKTSQASS